MNMCVQECATDAGVSLNSWYKWESGYRVPEFDLLVAVARAAGTTPSKLLESIE